MVAKMFELAEEKVQDPPTVFAQTFLTPGNRPVMVLIAVGEDSIKSVRTHLDIKPL